MRARRGVVHRPHSHHVIQSGYTDYGLSTQSTGTFPSVAIYYSSHETLRPPFDAVCRLPRAAIERARRGRGVLTSLVGEPHWGRRSEYGGHGYGCPPASTSGCRRRVNEVSRLACLKSGTLPPVRRAAFVLPVHGALRDRLHCRARECIASRRSGSVDRRGSDRACPPFPLAFPGSPPAESVVPVMTTIRSQYFLFAL